MGYAIFTARKLMLTNRINQMNFRMMQLSQQQMSLADQAARLQDALSKTKSMFSMIGNVFQTSYQNSIMAGFNSAKEADAASGNNAEMTAFLQNYSNMGGTNFFGTELGTTFLMVNQMIETQSEYQIKTVKEMENQIQMEMKTLDTQLKAASEELQRVEKAEENQIKNSAPNYA